MFEDKGISSAVIAVIAIVIIVVVGVGGYLAMTDNGDEGPADNEGPPISMTWEMEDTQFLPQTIEVDVGDTVRIVNNDSITHTFDSQNPETGDVVINETIGGGESITFTFDTEGVWEVWCRIHSDGTETEPATSGMRGRVGVGVSVEENDENGGNGGIY